VFKAIQILVGKHENLEGVEIILWGSCNWE